MKQSLPIFPKLLDELLQKIGKSSQGYANELAKKMARLSQEMVENLIRQKNQKVLQINQGIEESYQWVVDLCKQSLRGPEIRFEIPAREIKQAQSKTAFYTPSTAVLIEGKALAKQPYGCPLFEVDCVIASKNWHKLGEIKSEKINLMDHLDKLLPQERCRITREEKIGVVTFQNGMANNLGDFIKSSELIFDQFAEAPLCIGLYNATYFQSCPSPVDMIRFLSEKHLNPSSVFSLCQMMKTLAASLSKMNPNLLWVHFAHSEGGLIANAALEACEEMFFEDTRKYLQNNLITSTYGAVKPIADEYTKFALNTYSKNDIALFYGKDYIDSDLEEMIKSSEPIKKKHQGKTYTVKVIDSKVEPTEWVKMPVQMPVRLSLKQYSELSFFEYLAYREEIDDAPWTTQACINLVNDFFYRVKDHGFMEASYREEFVRHADVFKEKFEI